MNQIRGAVSGSLLLAAALTLTACGPADGADPEPRVTVTETETSAPEPDADPTPSTDAITLLAVEIAWSQQERSDKRDMCNGIALFGKDWAAGALQAGLDRSDGGDIDADLAASLLEQKCEEEGF